MGLVRGRKALLAAAIVAAVAAVSIPVSAAGKAPSSERILGGVPAGEGTYPFAAAVLIRDKFACSGSVLDSRHIITAGHCSLVKLKELKVATGRYDLRDLSKGQVTTVIAKYTHPDYRKKARHDLAIFTLAEPTTAPAIQLPATTAEGDAAAAPGTLLTAAGWGSSSPFGDRFPGFLKSTAVTAVGKSRCTKVYGKAFVGETMICAAGAKFNPAKKGSLRTSPCPGDSGGPLLGTTPEGAPRLLAVVSYGPTICGLPFAPVAYAKTFDAEALAFIGQSLAVPVP